MIDVHWKEGMLLLPQHLQALRGFALGRAEAAMLDSGVKRYGVRRLELELTSESIGVQRADVVLPDGTRVRSPEECSVPSHSIARALERMGGKAVDVWLGVPRVALGVSVVATADHRSGRYHVEVIRVRDEVEGDLDSECEIEVRRLNARIFVGDEDRDGFECLRIARVKRRSDLDPEPILDPTFVPPLLDVTADPHLSRRLSEVATALREKNSSLAEEVASRPFSFALQTGADPESIFKLSATNAHVLRLEQLVGTKGVHPFDVYLELCQLAGSMAIFTAARRAPDLPIYDHEDLATCFGTAIAAALGMLDASIRRFFEVAEFALQDGGVRPVCRVEPLWLEAGSELYLGVRTDSLAPEALDAALGSRVKLFGHGDEAAQLAVAGVRLERQIRVPAALPEATGVHYYRLDRAATPTPRWNAVEAAKALELVTTGAPLMGVSFSLYAVPRRTS